MTNDDLFLGLLKRAVKTKYAGSSEDKLLDMLAASMHRRCMLARAARQLSLFGD